MSARVLAMLTMLVLSAMSFALGMVVPEGWRALMQLKLTQLANGLGGASASDPVCSNAPPTTAASAATLPPPATADVTITRETGHPSAVAPSAAPPKMAPPTTLPPSTQSASSTTIGSTATPAPMSALMLPVTSSAANGYGLLVGQYPTPQAAAGQVRSLKSLGLTTAQWQMRDGDGQTWTVVTIGTFAREADALAQRAALSQQARLSSLPPVVALPQPG